MLVATLVLSAAARSPSCDAASGKCRPDSFAQGTSLLQVTANPEFAPETKLGVEASQEPLYGPLLTQLATGSADETTAAPAKAAPAGTTAAPATAEETSEGTTTAGPAPNSTVANVTNASMNASNATEAEVSTTPPAPTGCAVKEDPRAKAWFAQTSPEATPCVFGVDGDDRDEGSHCIFDNGDFGSNGWCYTAKDRSSWGSCNSLCPLYGPVKALGKKIDHMDKMVDKVLDHLNKTSAVEAAQNASESGGAANVTKEVTDAPKDAKKAAPAKDAKEAAPAAGAKGGPKKVTEKSK